MATLEDYDFDPRNLPQDLLAAIGLMTTSAAHTESCVDEAIAGCLGIDYEYGQAVTTHMLAHGFSIPQLVELVRAGLASATAERVRAFAHFLPHQSWSIPKADLPRIITTAMGAVESLMSRFPMETRVHGERQSERLNRALQDCKARFGCAP
jgi:hypothetical protein